MTWKKILVIDDEAVIRETITEMLQRAGYEVWAAADGGEDIELFREKDVDLVITDIIMPEVEGIETIRTLLQDQPDIKIIAISGGGRISNDDLLQMAGHFGAKLTLKKPFEREELLTAVRTVLDS